VTIVALCIAGLGSLVTLFLMTLAVVFIIPSSDLPLLSLMLIHVAVDGVSGILLLAGVVALMRGRTDRGVALAAAGLLLALALGDLLSFYLRQFDSIVVVLFHLALLLGVYSFRRDQIVPLRQAEA
jgi:hypothetical protein